MFVSDEGEILDHSARIFTKQAIEEKKNSNLENKLKKNIVKSNKRQYENALLNETSIVPNYLTNPEKKKKISQSTGSTIVSNSHVQTGRTTANLMHQTTKYNNFPTNFGNNCQPSTSRNNRQSKFIIQQEISRLQKNVISSSMQQHDVPKLQVNILSQKSEPQKTSMQHSHSNSCQIDKVTNTQMHHGLRASISPPAVMSEIVRSPFNGDKTSTSENVYPSNDDEKSLSSSSEDEDSNKENWSATFPGNGNFFKYFYSSYTAFNYYLTILINSFFLVTQRDVAFQKLLLAAMKHAYKSAHATDSCKKTFEVCTLRVNHS